MKGYPWACAAALLLSLASAQAADEPEHLTPNAQKLLATLNMLDINDKDVQQFVADTDHYTDHKGKLAIAGDEILGGQWSLKYDDTFAVPAPKHFELHYVPNNSNLEIEVSGRQAQMDYRLGF